MSDQPDRPEEPASASVLLEALLESARSGARQTLRSQIVIARNTRERAAMSVFLHERHTAHRDELITPSGRNRISGAAVKGADAAADAIMKAGIAAGATDAAIAEYAMHDYRTFIHSHMMSTLGHLRSEDGPRVRQQLLTLDHNTSIDTQNLCHLVKVLRAEYEERSMAKASINVHASGGAQVSWGTNGSVTQISGSHMHVELAPEDRAGLVRELAVIREAVADLPASVREEVHDAMRLVERELDRQPPKPKLLSGCLSVLANLATVYQVLEPHREYLTQLATRLTGG